MHTKNIYYKYLSSFPCVPSFTSPGIFTFSLTGYPHTSLAQPTTVTMTILYSSLDEWVDTNNFSLGVIAWPGLPMPELLANGRILRRKATYLLARRCSNRCCLNLFSVFYHLSDKLLLSDVLKGFTDYRTHIRTPQSFSTVQIYLK